MDRSRLDLAEVRVCRQEATQKLLGDTISITDEQWNIPSLLPGWTRAHIATHIARNADAFVRVMDQLRSGRPTSLYDSDATRREAVERGSERSALELQVDLDSSAGRLHANLAELMTMPPDKLVRLSPTIALRLDHLPIARLNEIVLHHIDMDVGYTYKQIDDQVAAWLLAFNAGRIGRTSAYPAIRITSDSGITMVIGGSGKATTVRGADNYLLAWITGRLPTGEADKRLPLLPCR